ncbi:hypothetical protein NEOLI_004001 [Neolecta irregularis DAH-3]|uniref:Uncharacterized protein n=1 Tax=Neolecta irregularis (strain DAH-3) TaxID=1198029 RepID=A0A1U7LRB5_NEOID|nr:hypothetical protein NEOLI_004001 [Neolecta irregularis DAH-3]|eukprot:OLL25205.1 hypothetical protein NEOLI_004001 [Neolecta irregularis DAH-3]
MPTTSDPKAAFSAPLFGFPDPDAVVFELETPDPVEELELAVFGVADGVVTTGLAPPEAAAEFG